MARPAQLRKRVLQALDAMMVGGPEHTSNALTPQLARFRDRNGAWLFADGMVGYGYLGPGGFYHRANGSQYLAVYADSADHQQALAKYVPRRVQLPVGKTDLLDLDTEIINIGSVQPRNRFRPVQPGLDISSRTGRTGTFGLLVRRVGEPSTDFYILSCNHVLVEYNQFRQGAPILQPGYSSGGQDPTDVIGELSHYVPLTFGDRIYLNTVDAALARVTVPADVVAEILHLGPPGKIARSMSARMPIKFSGATSGVSHGAIHDPSARLRVKYERDPGSTSYVGFQDVVLASPCSKGGDSGACVLADNGDVLGLVMAGSDRATLFCKMGNICESLGVEIVSVLT